MKLKYFLLLALPLFRLQNVPSGFSGILEDAWADVEMPDKFADAIGGLSAKAARMVDGNFDEGKYLAVLKEIGVKLKPWVLSKRPPSEQEKLNWVVKPLYARSLDSLPGYEQNFLRAVVAEHDSKLSAWWKKPKEVSKGDVSTLEGLIKEVTGKTGVSRLTIKEANDLKEDDPALYKEYLRLRRNANKDIEFLVADIVIQSGQPAMRIEDIADELKEEYGLTLDYNKDMGELFLDAKGNMYLNSRIRITPKPPYSSETQVKWNDRYDPNKDDQWIMQVKPPGGATFGYVYSQNYRKESQKEKYAVVNQHIDSIAGKRSSWLADMDGDLDDDRQLIQAALGAITELLYSVSARIGDARNENDGKQTYGLTTLQVKHLNRTGRGYTMNYDGKKGVRQRHVVYDPRVVEVLDALVEGKRPSDLVFQVGKQKIYNAFVNKYLRQKSLPNAHKFRTIKGTTMFLNKSNSLKWPSDVSERQVEEKIKKIALDVGKQLGHKTQSGPTWTTAAKSYIDPEAMSNIFTGLDLEPPKWLRQAKYDD